MRPPKQSYTLSGATPTGELAGENSSNKWSDGVRVLVSEGLSKQWRGERLISPRCIIGEWKEDHCGISGQF